MYHTARLVSEDLAEQLAPSKPGKLLSSAPSPLIHFIHRPHFTRLPRLTPLHPPERPRAPITPPPRRASPPAFPRTRGQLLALIPPEHSYLPDFLLPLPLTFPHARKGLMLALAPRPPLLSPHQPASREAASPKPAAEGGSLKGLPC